MDKSKSLAKASLKAPEASNRRRGKDENDEWKKRAGFVNGIRKLT